MANQTRAPRTHRTIRNTAYAAAAVLAINAGMIAGYTPTAAGTAELSASDRAQVAAWQAEHPGVDVALSATVTSSSLLLADATATVSGIGGDSIHVATPGSGRRYPLAYTLSHELHHAQQLDLVEAAAGATPHVLDPAATASYFAGMGFLNAELESIQAGGFEVSADCYAIWVEQDSAGDVGPAYLDSPADCSPELLAAAIAVAEGVWPDAAAVAARTDAATELLATVKVASRPDEKPAQQP